MQDLRSIPGGGRIFGGGDRRLRPYPNQPLKCPRCESLNTKFCYYNNYNLSQPRHFCKNCRRYWTKGGVLRNVPVGGGCRKTKRSKPKTSQEKEKKSNNNNSINNNNDNNNNAASHSSSESSSLTNTNTNATNEAASSSVVFHNNNNNNSGGNTFHDARSLYLNQTANSNFEPYALDQGSTDGVMFGEPGSFTNLMTVPNPSFLPYNFNQISPFRLQHQEEDEMKMQELTAATDMGTTQAGCLDQTVPVDLAGTSNGELTSALDCWKSGGCAGAGAGADQGLFDLPNAGDQGYWGQSQWTDNDHHLYLPP